MQTFVSDSVDMTIKIGKQIGESLCGGDILLLTGEMGAGKTHIAKGIALAMGVKQRVLSPTFCIHQMLDGRQATFNHFDLYRIATSEEIVHAGLDEYFTDSSCVCVIEWWQNAADLIPKKKCKVLTIQKTGDNSRLITFENFSEFQQRQAK